MICAHLSFSHGSGEDSDSFWSRKYVGSQPHDIASQAVCWLCTFPASSLPIKGLHTEAVIEYTRDEMGQNDFVKRWIIATSRGDAPVAQFVVSVVRTCSEMGFDYCGR